MRKFRFNNVTPAKVANPAKVSVNDGYPSAKPLLIIAKVEQKNQGNTTTLANISNTLASQESFKINNLSNFSRISRGGRSISEKSLQQQHDDLWQKAWKLADWIDDSGSDIPWQERAAKVPELQEMSSELDRLESLNNREN